MPTAQCVQVLLEDGLNIRPKHVRLKRHSIKLCITKKKKMCPRPAVAPHIRQLNLTHAYLLFSSSDYFLVCGQQLQGSGEVGFPDSVSHRDKQRCARPGE
jgi:hypothetical protein